ncbi:T6SS immunity protein Tdi1 domain-containing protein [Novosphingobium malaysiense]|uniref:T6SS immunity protein Tdi1 C-terminal domain-containing protein n=1 Tax=Novosphingobium malaysiense TaxID=1348853 RepID=A0A0B1ZLE1_9SPHN|nr:T6SS immunity protein Tdi1 domain-containing protein [Novosphingobium malaysiense]KHK90003.1 hypothetical protein LK12_19150 [Novosphingobium malaysiense]
MSRVMQALRRDWGWTGVDFAEIIAVSRMGHLLLSDTDDAIHYLDPETRELIRLGGEEQAAQYMADPEVALVWRAEALVQAARDRLGEPAEEEVYTLTPDALLAGDYAHENLVRQSLADLISFAGQVAYQTRDLPDGTPIKLKATD